ncbi:MAG TPA: hypothetical protein VJ875_09945 [Pyrinomonadaceae bacterium]|nr:hypothetical protein [Pyrinomonadaceae bacterium]
MKELLTDALLREFLLGKVDEEERERIEGLFLTDSQARERVLAAEQDLIEDYLEDSLTAADRDLFLARYGQTPAQQRQLRINKSIKNWALRETASTHVVPAKISALSHLRERLRLKSPFIIPIAITALIAIIVVAVWFSSRREQQNRHLAIEQELAQLNTPSSLREVPPQMAPLELSPVAIRSVEQETEFKKTADTRVVELRLPWIQKERYATYQAEVRRVGDDGSFTIPNLQAEGDGEPVIRVRLPAHMLHRGHYQIQLNGIASDGSMSLPEKYQFAVSG